MPNMTGSMEGISKPVQSVSGLGCSECAEDRSRNCGEEPEGNKQPRGRKRLKIPKWINYLNDRDKW